MTLGGLDVLYNVLQGLVDVVALTVLARGVGRLRPVGIVAATALSAILLAPLLAPLLEVDLFLIVRLLCWGIFVHGTLVFAGAAALGRGPRRLVWAGLSAVLVAIGVDAFFVEPHALELNRQTIAVRGLERPLTVAVVADLQTDHVTDHERRALELVMGARPDLILFPGDLVQADPIARYQAVQRDLNALFHEVGLSAPLGVVAVKGNVDWGPGRWQDVFDGLEVRASDTTVSYDLGPVVVTALSFDDGFDPLLVVPPLDDPQIIVAHGPDFALGRPGGEVLVAGHTHGGQVQLPGIGPLMTLSRVPRPWASGRTDLGERALVVSRGVGMERHNAPRFRFLCRPEVVILDLVPMEPGRR
ncbi:MAG: metallophosphoesterase [Alphaproteobacteria bacterium]|nr:metallophosphoesterase [Alphaproteobacteria bacterium]